LVGDTISVSYGEAWDTYRYNEKTRGKPLQTTPGNLEQHNAGNEYETVKFRGWSAAMNIGPLAIKGTKNNVDGMGLNGKGDPKSHSEVNLSLAF